MEMLQVYTFLLLLMSVIMTTHSLGLPDRYLEMLSGEVSGKKLLSVSI